MSADIQLGMPLLTWHHPPWSPPWAHFFKKICQTCIYLFLFLLLYTVGLVAWERLEIVDVTCVPRTISPLPIRGDNQPNLPVGGSPTRGIDLAFAPFGLYATISPLPRPSAYLFSCSICICNPQRINHFATHFQVGAA